MTLWQSVQFLQCPTKVVNCLKFLPLHTENEGVVRSLYQVVSFIIFIYLFIWGFKSLSTLYRSYHEGQIGRAEETSTYSLLGFCTVNCRPTASNYQLSHLRPCRESNPGLRGGRRECYHSATVAPIIRLFQSNMLCNGNIRWVEVNGGCLAVTHIYITLVLLLSYCYLRLHTVSNQWPFASYVMDMNQTSKDIRSPGIKFLRQVKLLTAGYTACGVKGA